MFHFLKKIFNLQTSQALTCLTHELDINKVSWVAIAINKKTMADSYLTKELDITTDKNAFSLKIAETPKEILHQLWKNQEAINKSKTKKNSPLLLEFNLLLDKLIENEIMHFQQQLNLSREEKPLTSETILLEEKAKEWLRVSFIVLEKAIIESLTNPEFFFQALLFLGINPKTSLHEIRIIAFNLDIKFQLLQNGALRIDIFNDKNNELGTHQKAALAGEFTLRNKEMFDELTRIIAVLSKGIKW